MFSTHSFSRNFENTQDIFCPKQGIGETQSSYMNCHITQNPFNLPKNFYDNFSSFSGNSNSTNASISQMTSLYMANQRKKAFTDEINLCLNKSLEKILPMVAKRTAELIYSSISQILIDNEKNLRELRNSFDTLKAKKSNDMKNIQNVYGNLNKVNEKLNNCGILLNNQIKFAQGNEEFKNQQQELLNKIMGKFEYIKGILAKQKDFSGKLNECIKSSLANIISAKINYKNELIKIQDNIQYDIINNGNGTSNNIENQIKDISLSINEFKNKIDNATNIYLQPINPIKNNINYTPQTNVDTPNTNNTIGNECENNGKLRKLFGQVNGSDFRF